MKKRIIYFIFAMALAMVGCSLLGLLETEFSLKELFAISLLFTAGGFIGKAFDDEFSSFSDLRENKFFEIRSAVEENEFFYYQVLQGGEIKHIRDVREFSVGTYIRSGKEITLRTGH